MAGLVFFSNSETLLPQLLNPYLHKINITGLFCGGKRGDLSQLSTRKTNARGKSEVSNYMFNEIKSQRDFREKLEKN